MSTEDSYTRPDVPEDELALTGPSVEVEPGHLPVRGDLAHIKLAGRYFVPHYAVPMAHTIKAGGACLRAAAKSEADEVSTLGENTTFNVLDMAGGWAWGQVGEDGQVGYVLMDKLEGTGT